MRIVFALVVLCFLVLPAGCNKAEESPDTGGAPVTEPVANTAEELNEILPPPSEEGSTP